MNSYKFFENNTQDKPILTPIPKNLNTSYEKANWIVNYSDFGFIELDLPIEVEKWKKELEKCYQYFVPHRSDDSKGWSSCCLHGIGIDKTGTWFNYGYKSEDEVVYDWTELSNHTPAIKKFCQNFPYDKFKRIRFMKLDPGGYIEPHSDAPGKLPGELGIDVLKIGIPINIAVVHPSECFFSLDGFGTVPFDEGKAFLINIRHYHSVINNSNQPRIHLILQGVSTQNLEQFTDLLVRSYEKTYAKYS